MIVRLTPVFLALALPVQAAPAFAQSESAPPPPLPSIEGPAAPEVYSAAQADIPREAERVTRPPKDAYAQDLLDAGHSARWRAGWIDQCSATLSYRQCEDYLRLYEQSYETAFGGSVTYTQSGNPGVMWIRVPAAGCDQTILAY